MDHSDLLKELRIDRSQREAQGTSPRWPWVVVPVVLGVAAAVAGAWWWLPQRAIEVKTAMVLSPSAGHDASAVLQATGYVTARRQATVSAQITGTLTEVLIEEGDRVSRGQVLARLDDAQHKAALTAARTQAAAAHALVAQYQVQLAQYQRDAHRSEQLAAQGVVAKQVAEQSLTLVDSTRAQLAAQRKQADSADAQVTEAQVSFDYCVVRAPFDGIITTKDAQVGEIISPLSAGGGFTRTGIGTIVDMDSLEVDVDVNEAYIGRVKSGMPAQAVLDAYPDWRIAAHVIAIVPAANRGKATVKVRVALEQKDARIVPDMGVRVSFLEQKPAVATQAEVGVLVPAQAFARRDGHDVLFVVQGDRVQQRDVQPEQSGGAFRRVPSGVAAGDSVVIDPPADLRGGTKIHVDAAPAS